MIIIMAYKTFEDKYPVERKIIAQFPNEHDFGFNIGDPVQWRKFLMRDKTLPIRTKKGVSVSYRVYIWGGIKGIREPGFGSGTTLFPGMDPVTKKRLQVSKYGRLDAGNEYWDARARRKEIE